MGDPPHEEKVFHGADVEVVVINALKDNYCYLVRRPDSNRCFIIDTSELAPIQTAVESRNLKPELILNTHHHHDHIGANLPLKTLWDCHIYCSSTDVSRIPGADRGLEDGEHFEFDGIVIQALHIPGHTRGQLGYYLPKSKHVFVGDTLFSMGCGRLLEGSPTEMAKSLNRLCQLPPDTQLHFGHEYAEKNGAFASNVEPDNGAIQVRLRSTREAIARFGHAVAPTLEDELRVNPFLRLNSRSLRRQLGLNQAGEVEVFTSLRRLRDSFQG